MIHSHFKHRIEYYRGRKFIVIIDLNIGGKSVTNDIENVVKYIGKTENIDVNKYLIIYQDTEGTWDAWDPITETFVLLSEDNYKVAMGKYIAKLSEQYAISK